MRAKIRDTTKTKATMLDPKKLGGLDITVAGTYFEGTCSACSEPERGGVVVVLTVGAGDQGRMRFRLCPSHYDALKTMMAKLGSVREI